MKLPSLSPPDLALLDRFQRGLPLERRPFRVMADALGTTESSVIERLEGYQFRGVISRVGPVFRPHTVGSSTLAALAVSPTDLEGVAQLVNAYPSVNHNYEREHRYNLWFVVTGDNQSAVDDTLADIEARTGLEALNLPLIRDFHIDLGFPLSAQSAGAGSARQSQCRTTPAGRTLTDTERDLVSLLAPGLPLVSRPYREVGKKAGLPEDFVTEQLGTWLRTGIVKRHGVVVRHHELGYRANGMVVWDIPDGQIEAVGRTLAAYSWVTLCYQRPRRAPGWPYSLFTMVHGRDRPTVQRQVSTMASESSLLDTPRATLFSLRRFKQCGAPYGVHRPAAAVA